MASGDRPAPFSRRLLQGVRFLPQGFEDADTLILTDTIINIELEKISEP
jgi:hypothetical protein